MSQKCKILKKRKCEITNSYSTKHKAVDIVGESYTIDDVLCYEDGQVVQVQKNKKNNKGSHGNESYGNFIKIKHNGYYTLYAHLENNIKYNMGDIVKEGSIIATMGDSGNAYGKHLHFEIIKNGVKIDPTKYLDKKLIEKTSLKYNVGDNVEYNKIYESSSSDNSLNPLYKSGTITKIYPNTRNPYLIDNNVGFINDDCIMEKSSIKIGDKVKVKTGSKDYNGTALAKFVYNNVYDVIEIKNDRVVIGINNKVTCAININNIEKK